MIRDFFARYALAGLAALCAILAGAAGYQTVRLEQERTAHQTTKADHDRAERERQAAATAAAIANLRKIARTMDRQQEADDAQAARQTALVADAARARSAVAGLQHRIATLSAAVGDPGNPDPTVARQRQAIEALGIALGQCSARHQQLADEYSTDWNAGRACEGRYDALTAKDPKP